MALSSFHPLIGDWFATELGPPTPAQARGWPPIRAGHHTLIAAPTGAGKTLAAFLYEIDALFREGLAEGGLPDETRVVYVSPLKALSSDVHVNLGRPRRRIAALALQQGLSAPPITTAVRTGDTSAAARAAMVRRPPHILVTTPESLYLLLTSSGGRSVLRTARTVIVDEIHALVPSRRGAHLALSLERLDRLAGRPLQRIGLSATQRPVEEVARFLVGAGGGEARPCVVIDEGHQRPLDLALELPASPLDAVTSAAVWSEIYDRLSTLVSAHETTLVFVNTRRLAERLARHLAERLGEEAVSAHHGSLATDRRMEAERRLKQGLLKALVATASLEMGIDIGSVDLVCQIGSPHSIATLLQRVGRAGHHVGGVAKGRLFPLTRDDLVESVALLWALREGELESIYPLEAPLDVLAQQLVAETAAQPYDLDELYALVTQAWPYRRLDRHTFDKVVRMLAGGFATPHGRRGALVHHDRVHGRLRGRRGARLVALTSGGAIPDKADYRVVQEPEQTFVGTVNEDFAVESMAGDIFQLGNTSWRILRIESGTVRVEDGRGQPPTIPFWFGEAPSRSDELSRAVARLRAAAEEHLCDPGADAGWLTAVARAGPEAAEQVLSYLREARRVLGALPTQQTLVVERFFDASGGMQLVLHAPFGARLNRAWGLALRKRFCRTFNFELQAAATEEAVLLSLGPQHSFPLDEVFTYLQPATVGETLVQAVLDAPMFQTRWRWNVNVALAVPRRRGARKVPPPLQRMQAEDLLVAVFPDALACLENIAGEREVPDHPLVHQTLSDCLHEAMDVGRLQAVLAALQRGELRCISRDVPEPSALAHEVLSASPYAFLDDAPLEERRAQAVYRRRAFEPSSIEAFGVLDPAAIARVRDEVRPDARDADELHDVLLSMGCLPASEAEPAWHPFFEILRETGRATKVCLEGREAPRLWVAAERLHEGLGLWDGAVAEPPLLPMAPLATREIAARELVRNYLEFTGPTSEDALARSLHVPGTAVARSLRELEAEGSLLRGRFTAEGDGLEWCNRRLLARIHRYTLNRLRAEIQPVSTADFMRFLFAWQRAGPEHRASGLEGLYAVIEQLDGFSVPAGAWEHDVLALRVGAYDPYMLDALCFTGRVAWARLAGNARGQDAPPRAAPIRSTPIALSVRDHLPLWLSLAAPAWPPSALSGQAAAVFKALTRRGALFFHELVQETRLLPAQLEGVLAELAGSGHVTADSYAGLRVLLTPSSRRRPRHGGNRRHRTVPFSMETAGRWSLLEPGNQVPAAPDREQQLEAVARILLRRYGIVFRRLLGREQHLPPWRDLVRTLWRLEARGEVRGGRFVAGMPGEHFGLPEAVGLLRATRRRPPSDAPALLSISAADPLNLTGTLMPGPRIPALAANRVLYQRGVPVAALERGEAHMFEAGLGGLDHVLRKALMRQPPSEPLRADFGLPKKRTPRWEKPE